MEGLPQSIDLPGAWLGCQFPDDAEYIYQLSDIEVEEVKNALLQFLGTNMPSGHFILYTPSHTQLISICSPRPRWRLCLSTKLPTSYFESEAGSLTHGSPYRQGIWSNPWFATFRILNSRLDSCVSWHTIVHRQLPWTTRREG